MPERLAILKRVVLFQHLTDQDLQEVAERINRRSYKLGDYLFRAGTNGPS